MGILYLRGRYPQEMSKIVQMSCGLEMTSEHLQDSTVRQHFADQGVSQFGYSWGPKDLLHTEKAKSK